jgi:uncharacterized protein with NRDE domain
VCLIAFAYAAHPRYRLVVAANRDEWTARPAAPLHEWQDAPGIIAGRDTQAGGTWMGVSRAGRFAALTNFREPRGASALARPARPSRGALATDFLQSHDAVNRHLANLAGEADRYEGFNLLLDDGAALAWCSNRPGGWAERVLTPGQYGLSNGTLDAPWPKVERAKAGLARALDEHGDNPDALVEALLETLADSTRAPDDALPATGVPLEWERVLSPVYIRAETTPLAADYGTRASTALLLTHDGFGRIVEVSHAPARGRVEMAFRLQAFC